MRHTTFAILAFVCFSLLSLQFSGLHQHVDTQGQDNGIHGTHLHDVESDSHDHHADIDASFFELGARWSKTIPFLIVLALNLLIIGRATRSVSFLYNHLLQPCRQTRWRPPLRAPPLPI
jgi:hypothetical protein